MDNVEYNNAVQILKQTDYVALKLAEGADPLQYAEVLKLRQACRDKINEWNGEDFVAPSFEDLRNRKYREIATARYNAEIAGVNGIRTDRESQGLITGAALKAMQDNTYTCKWKGIDGFVTLTAPQIIAIADAVREHVQECFNREATLIALIDNATTQEELNAIKWGD